MFLVVLSKVSTIMTLQRVQVILHLTSPAQRDEPDLSSDNWDFIFSGDSSDLDFARRLERFCVKGVH